MASLKIVYKVLITTFIWAALWGLVGAAAGVVATLIEPDTGHIPRQMVPVMIGVPSAVFGAVAGLVFASLLVPSGIPITLGTKGRSLVGAIVGSVTGIVLMNILAHSMATVVLAALLGAALGARFTRPESLAGSK